MDQPTVPILQPKISSLGLLKKHLARKQCITDAVMKEAVISWLQTLDDFSYTGLQSIKCLNANADHREV
jgi:hypothetical protein